MKVAIRAFALLVAFAGLASASMTPASNQTLSQHTVANASGPVPLNLPAPLPCQATGACVVAADSAR